MRRTIGTMAVSLLGLMMLTLGNSNTNASNSSPARVAEAITVGATTMTDARSSFSNFGSVVDIFAPGSSISRRTTPATPRRRR